MAIRGSGRVWKLALSAALLIAPAAAAAPASAATISVNKSCYVTGKQRAQMTVVGSGFVPGDSVVLSSGDGTVNATGTVSATGTIAITAGAPIGFKSVAQETTTVTATDFSIAGTLAATTSVNAAPLAVMTKPARSKFTRPVTFLFAGFKPGKQIYAHFLHPKPVAREQFGKATGPCGVLTTKALLYPGGHPRFKTYKLQFDDAKAYSPHASPRIDTKLNTFVI